MRLSPLNSMILLLIVDQKPMYVWGPLCVIQAAELLHTTWHTQIL